MTEKDIKALIEKIDRQIKVLEEEQARVWAATGDTATYWLAKSHLIQARVELVCFLGYEVTETKGGDDGGAALLAAAGGEAWRPDAWIVGDKGTGETKADLCTCLPLPEPPCEDCPSHGHGVDPDPDAANRLG